MQRAHEQYLVIGLCANEILPRTERSYTHALCSVREHFFSLQNRVSKSQYKPTMTSSVSERDRERNVDRGYAWVIVVVVMLNMFNMSIMFATFSVLYREYVDTFDMTVGQIGITISVSSCATNLAGTVSC